MIRIDEIYNNTIWPWLKEHRPGTRVFFCDPFGHTAEHTAGQATITFFMAGPVWIGSADTIEHS